MGKVVESRHEIHRLLCFKRELYQNDRWYLTPDKLSKMYKKNNCWKYKQADSPFFHMRGT